MKIARAIHPVLGPAVVIVAAALGLAAAAREVRAGPARGDDDSRRGVEKVTTKGKTALRKRRGEKSRVVLRVGPKTRLQVVGRRGRWIRVRHRGRVGWVTRTSVRSPEAERERSARSARCEEERSSAWSRGVSPASVPKVVVSAARAQAFDRPDGDARALFDLERESELRVLARGGEGWYLVEGDEGRVGWVPRAAVRDKGFPDRAAKASRASERAEESTVLRERGLEPSGPPGLRARAGAGAGLLASGSRLDAEEGGYLATSYAPATAARGALDVRVAGALRAGVEARYLFATGQPGYRVTSAGETIEGVDFARHEVSGVGSVGYGRDFFLAARGGYHFESWNPDPPEKGSPLSEQTLRGPLAGVGLALPRVSERLALRCAVDVLVAPERESAGAEQDGGLVGWGTASATYRLAGALSVAATYRYARSEHTEEGSERRDQSHLLLLGLSLH